MKAEAARRAGELLRVLDDLDAEGRKLTPYVEMSTRGRRTALDDEGEHLGSVWMPCDVYKRMLEMLRAEIVVQLVDLGVEAEHKP